jgi:tetratricopeptide (TPR) repeat protein
MSATPSTQPVDAPTHRTGTFRRYLRIGLIGLVGVAVINGGMLLYTHFTKVEVPKLSPEFATEVDVVVAMRIEEARKAVEKNPSAPEAWGQLGMIFFAHQYNSDAAKCFTQAERLDPEDPRWKYFQAAIFESSDAPAALRKFEETLGKCGDNPLAVRMRYAELLVKENFHAEAEKEFRKVLQRDGTCARAHLGMARIEARRSAWDESMAHIERAIHDPVAEKGARMLLAEIYERRGQNELAAEQHRAADKLKRVAWEDPYMREALEMRTGIKQYYNRANNLYHSKNFQQAHDLLVKMTAVYPDAPQVWSKLAKVRIALEDWPGVEEAARRALAVEPETLEAQFQMGLVYEHRQDYKEASNWFRKTIEARPYFADGHYHLGLASVQLHDRAGAMESFQTALRCQPNLAEAHLALATELASGGKAFDALLHAQAVLHEDPKNAEAKSLLATVLPRLTFPSVP